MSIPSNQPYKDLMSSTLKTEKGTNITMRDIIKCSGLLKERQTGTGKFVRLLNQIIRWPTKGWIDDESIKKLIIQQGSTPEGINKLRNLSMKIQELSKEFSKDASVMDIKGLNKIQSRSIKLGILINQFSELGTNNLSRSGMKVAEKVMDMYKKALESVLDEDEEVGKILKEKETIALLQAGIPKTAMRAGGQFSEDFKNFLINKRKEINIDNIDRYYNQFIKKTLEDQHRAHLIEIYGGDIAEYDDKTKGHYLESSGFGDFVGDSLTDEEIQDFIKGKEEA